MKTIAEPKQVHQIQPGILGDLGPGSMPLGMGKDAQIVVRIFQEASEHFHFPISRFRSNTTFRFLSLLRTWKEETKYLSLIYQKVMHPAYLEMIGMGPQIVPLLLEELGREPNFLFPALAAITGQNPVRREHQGDIEKITQDWLDWGRREGHLQ